MHRVVFMGTPDFAAPALQKLMQTQHVVGVVTQPDKPAGRGQALRLSPVKLLAQAAGVPVYQPRSLKSEAAAAPLHAWAPDVIVVAAFGQILRPHVLHLPRHGCLNVHASLLPRWRGASPIQHALLAADTETGVCLMQMDEGLDTGPVYVCQATPISTQDTAVSLHDRLAYMGAELLGQYLNDILNGQVKAISQNDALSTYAPMIKKEDGRLDWRHTAAELERRIRALTPWPGAFTTWQGDMLKILRANLAPTPLPAGSPGEIRQLNENTVVLAGAGGIQLQEVQLAGKKVMSIQQFIHGRPDFIGAQLGD